MQKQTLTRMPLKNNLIYNFKNTKKEGTITFTKKWKDRKNNDDRPIPDIEISTKKPKKI